MDVERFILCLEDFKYIWIKPICRCVDSEARRVGELGVVWEAKGKRF